MQYTQGPIKIEPPHLEINWHCDQVLKNIYNPGLLDITTAQFFSMMKLVKIEENIHVQRCPK